MSRVPTNRQADIKRAIGALKAHGLGIARIDFPVAGGFSVIPGPLTTEPASAQRDDLDAWRNRNRGAGAA